MSQRKRSRPPDAIATAILALRWIPLTRAQVMMTPSSTADLSTPSSTLSTFVSSSPTVSSFPLLRTSNSIQPSSSTSFTPSSLSSPSLPYIVASSNPTASTVPESSKQIQQEDQDNGLVNSYFAILALLVLFVFLGLWLLHRRKKQAKARRITDRREALARDLDSWASRDGAGPAAGNGQSGFGFGRYWGHWRSWSDGYTRREEGLDERGEAPPAYSPRVLAEDPQTEARTDTDTGGRQGEDHSGARSLQIPLRTLSRGEVPGLKPPEYVEMVRSVSPDSENGMPGSATVLPSPAHAPPSRDGNGTIAR